MSRLKTIKLFLFFAALIFAAKPFVGFAMAGHLHSAVKTNIFVKIFSQRKIEDHRSVMKAIQKQLSAPLANLFLRFTCLLALLFPLAFRPCREITGGFLHWLKLSLLPLPPALFSGQLLI